MPLHRSPIVTVDPPQAAKPRSCTVLLKGPNKHTLGQLKDAVRDGLQAPGPSPGSNPPEGWVGVSQSNTASRSGGIKPLHSHQLSRVLDPLFSIRSTVAPPLRSALCGQGSE